VEVSEQLGHRSTAPHDRENAMSDPTSPQPPENQPPENWPPENQPPPDRPAGSQQPPPAYGQPQQPTYGPPPGYAGQPMYQQPVNPGGLTNDEITWGSAAHWSALVATVIGLPFLGPLIVMLTKGNELPYVRRQAVESLNFQLSIMIYAVVSFVLLIVVVGIFLLLIVGLAWLVFTIIGAVRASHGEEYRYPLTIRMVS
jgi:uncharacterized protein